MEMQGKFWELVSKWSWALGTCSMHLETSRNGHWSGCDLDSHSGRLKSGLNDYLRAPWVLFLRHWNLQSEFYAGHWETPLALFMVLLTRDKY